MKLTIELVPKTSWYNNVRSHVSRSEWDILRKECYKRANNKCEICSDSGQQECHEIWEYDDLTHVQKLVQLISLCNKCHTVKHPGLASINGKKHIVEQQLMKINNMTKNEAVDYIINSFEIWEKRNKFKWIIDITYLETYLTK